MKKVYSLRLPWPPSTNKNWAHGKGNHYLTDKVKTFRLGVKSVVVALHEKDFPLKGDLAIEVRLVPPDLRRRDEDNFTGKALRDALTKAGVWEDDSQVRESHNKWLPAGKPGYVLVQITRLEDAQGIWWV